MCGFAGFFDPAPVGGSPPGRVLRDMTATLVRRGPDDEGYWEDPEAGMYLGFRRLAILDLTEAGHQPMVSASGRFAMVFNGEVYNFAELRGMLGGDVAFRGDSDSEVLLACFEAWGPERAVSRFRGMFAIALWDRRERELWLMRDRMGIKPLFLARGERWLAFGSELRALLPHPRIEGRGCPDAAWHYLRCLYVPAPLSMIDGVEKVMPGSLIRFRTGADGAVQEERMRYWDLEEVAARGSASPAVDPEEALDRLHALLEESVRLRLVADVPVGALLSGGIDSSLVVALMAAQSDHPVRTFTIGFEDPRFDEGPVAAEVAQLLGARHTAVEMPPSELLGLVPELPEFVDEPLANPSLLPTLLVSRVARREVTVALTGDGGDELFGGYNRYLQFPRVAVPAERVPRLLRRPLGRLLDLGSGMPGVDAVARRLQPAALGSQHAASARLRRVASIVGAGSLEQAYLEFMAVGHARPPVRGGGPGGVDPGAFTRHRGSLQARMLLLDQMSYLPDDLLAKVDRASMWVSLEARVPVLDHRVVEFSWTLPDEAKIRDGRLKRPLRALAGRYLPDEILDRPKMGFTVPVDAWLRTDLSEWLGDQLAPERLRRRGLWNVAAVQGLGRRYRAGDAGLALSMWTLAVLEAWCERRGVTFD